LREYEDGILRKIKDYVKSYTSLPYIAVGFAGGTVGFIGGFGYTLAVEGFPQFVEFSYQGLNYLIQNFPQIDILECYQTISKAPTPIILESVKEGAKGFIEFGAGTIFAVKLLRNKIGSKIRSIFGGEK
jgi:hypothetical protein